MSTREKRELLIFDLDGTLIDSSEDIAWSVNRTLERLGIVPLPHGVILSYIGWGVKMLLEQALPEDRKELLNEAKGIFLDLYSRHLTVKTRPYPGVEETLHDLHGRGLKMAIVTNKPVAFTREILDTLSLTPLFTPILGGDSVRRKKPHPESAETVLRSHSLSPAYALFIGDSRIDIETGKAACIDTIGAAYGFRGRGELEDAGADHIIDAFDELTTFVR
ncbi:MAG: HAD family hydrolase [Thermodesulfobacteriota bacterium]